jgi:hypothetical protein
MSTLCTHGTLRATRARSAVEGKPAGGLAVADRGAVSGPHVQPAVVPARGLIAAVYDNSLARDLLLRDEQPPRRISDVEQPQSRSCTNRSRPKVNTDLDHAQTGKERSGLCMIDF